MRHHSAEQTQQSILSASLMLFAHHGYPNASVGELAAAAGVTKPTIYYYFKSKAGLYQAALDQAHDQAYASLLAAQQGVTGWRTRLVRLVDALLIYTRDNPDNVRIMFHAAFSAKAELPDEIEFQEKSYRNMALLTDAIEEGQRQGDLMPMPAEELTLALYGLVVINVMGMLVTPQQPVAEFQAGKLVDLFVDGARKKA